MYGLMLLVSGRMFRVRFDSVCQMEHRKLVTLMYILERKGIWS